MIRVLQFASCVNRHDFIDTIVQRADRTRFELGVCVGSSPSIIAEPKYPEDVRQWSVPWHSRKDLHIAAWRLAKILREWKPNVLHTHHYDEAIIGWLATRLHGRTRLVVGRHYSDAIYRSSTGLKRKALLAAEHIVNQGAVRIISPSQYICEILTKWQHLDPAKIDCIPYGFAAEKYVMPDPHDIARVRAEFGLAGHLVIGNFARLHEEKGQRYLIEAVASLQSRVSNLRVLIVGEGPERLPLERQIEAAGLADAISLVGWRSDAMTVMAAVDIVVQPTLQEAFSQVMAEALWMRKPLVITDVSGAEDIVRTGENGVVVPKADSCALARALEELANNANLRTRLGDAGHAFVRENLSIEKIIGHYELAYLEAVRH